MDLEDGTLLSKSLEAGVEHMDNFILGDSSHRELGFISPIKVLKATGSGYFLRSSSKFLMNMVSSGLKGLSTSINLNESELGTKQSDVIGALRAMDAHCKVTL